MPNKSLVPTRKSEALLLAAQRQRWATQKWRTRMGILADIFVASDDDASNYADFLLSEEGVPQDRFERVEYKGFTGLEFGKLWAIIANEKWDVSRHMTKNISNGRDGESWLDRFPTEMVAAFASLTSESVETLSVAWAGTDELNCEASDVEPVIEDLRRLSRLSIDSGKGMYLWGSL
jgi:hypothetical protein